MSKVIPPIALGQKFGRLKVVANGFRREPTPSQTRGAYAPRGFRAVFCLCDCGKVKDFSELALKQGKSISCGCYRREWASIKKRKHGRHHDYLYQVWNHIKHRTTNPNDAAWKNYGGRGILMYGPWLEDSSSFFNWICENLGGATDS